MDDSELFARNDGVPVRCDRATQEGAIAGKGGEHLPAL